MIQIFCTKEVLVNKLIVELDSDLFRELSLYCADLGETKKKIVARAIRKLLDTEPRRRNQDRMFQSQS